MKRIMSACLEQTNRFESEEEFAAFTSSMNRRQIAYKIVFKEAQPDGSVIAGVKRQYNHYSTGSYLD